MESMERVESLNRQYLRMASEHGERDGMEGYRSRILQRNRVEGLLRADNRHLDGVCYVYYDITSMVSMEAIFADIKITEAHLEELFDGLEDALQDMEAYLLRQSDLCLEPKYIMRNSETGKWAFLYIPGYGGNQAQELEKLAEYIMEHMDYSDIFLQERVYTLYDDVIRWGKKALPVEFIQLWRKTGKEKEDPFLPGEKKETVHGEASALPAPKAEETGTPDKCEIEKKTGERKKFVRKIYRTPYRGMEIQNVLQPPLTETL